MLPRHELADQLDAAEHVTCRRCLRLLLGMTRIVMSVGAPELCLHAWTCTTNGKEELHDRSLFKHVDSLLNAIDVIVRLERQSSCSRIARDRALRDL